MSDKITIDGLTISVSRLKDILESNGYGLYKRLTDSEIQMRIHSVARQSQKSIEYVSSQLIKGAKVELEHIKDRRLAEGIALDHLKENVEYYNKLK